MTDSKAVAGALRQFTTPTVSNAVELFNLRPRNEGFMSPAIRCLFPELGPLAGFAVTARYRARSQSPDPASRYEFWKYILTVPQPRVVVMEDLDRPKGVGAYFGEVQSTIHTALGCAGVVTDGCVRDLDEMRGIGFQAFAAGPCVSHAYVHLADFGDPVSVGGVTVTSGDIVHADKHGVLLVPAAAADVAEAVAKVAERERRIMDCCRASDFSLERLRDAYDS